MSKYIVVSEFEDAYCGIIVKELDDGFLHFKYTINMVDVDEIVNLEKLGELMSACNTWHEGLAFIIKAMDGHNWTIQIYTNDDKGNGIRFTCYGNDGPTIDLGELAECYDDCETCGRCHNITAQWDIIDVDSDNTQYDWCHYYCEGCHEHPCTNTNGRKAIRKALENV